MFTATNKVRMHDTDMAGRLYFAQQFRFAHDALEDFAASEGFSFDQVFQSEKFLFVIVHAEADYLQPLQIGDLLTTHVTVETIGTSSFAIGYAFYRNKQKVGTAQTVHVTLDRHTLKKISVPPSFRTVLKKHLT